MATMDNLLLGDLHGSISGLTFYGSPGKQKVRMKTNPVISISDNLKLNQNIMSSASRQWQFLDVPTKALWSVFAATYFHPHNIFSHIGLTGFSAFCGLYKMWIDSYYKLAPITYNFDANPPLPPVSVVMPDFSFTPPTADFFGDLCYTDYTNVTLTASKLELRNDGHVKFQLDFPHAVPPPAFENDWLTFDNQKIMFSVWCSEALPSVGSVPKNPTRYYLGCTGYITNPALTLSAASSCCIEMDCSNNIINNSSFPGVGSIVWLALDRICSSGASSGLYSLEAPKVAAFSF